MALRWKIDRKFYQEWLNRRWPIWAAKLLRAWFRLAPTRTYGLERLKDFPVFAIANWHGDDLTLFPRYPELNLTILISQSKDGEFLATAGTYLGHKVVRGSSSRGGAAGLAALIRAGRKGQRPVFAADGPQGPRGVAKPGVVYWSIKTGAPIVPVATAVSRKLVLRKTWSRSYLPLPFARQVVVFGEPFHVPSDGSDDSIEAGCRLVERKIEEARREAEARLSAWLKARGKLG